MAVFLNFIQSFNPDELVDLTSDVSESVLNVTFVFIPEDDATTITLGEIEVDFCSHPGKY